MGRKILCTGDRVDHELLVKLYKDGNGVLEIAGIIGCTADTVYKHLRRAGLKKTKWRPKTRYNV